MKGRNQDMWIMRRMAKVAMVLVITAAMVLPTALAEEHSITPPPSETAFIDGRAITVEGDKTGLTEPSSKPMTRDLNPTSLNKETGEEGPSPSRDVETILTMGFEDAWQSVDPDGDYDVPDVGWDIDGLCTCSQSGYPELYHYWGQYDASMYPLPHSGDYCAGLWWSDGSCGDYAQDEWIKTPVLDLSNYDNVVLTFWGVWNWIDAPGMGDNYYVMISDDDTTWYPMLDVLTIQEGTGGPAGYGWCWNEYQVVVDISENITNLGLDPSTIQIAWNAYGGSGDTLYGIIMLDDVEITGEPTGGPGPGPGELHGNDIAIVDLTLDGKSIQLDKGGCNRFHPGMHIPDVEVINQGNVSWVYPKPEGMPDENWAGKKATIAATIWKEISEVEWETSFEDNVLGDFMVIDEDGVCCDWWNISTQRVHSGEYSMKSSRYAEYMPCQDNILQTRKPNDMSMYDEGYLEFWFWVEGDWISTYWPYDYGYVEASDDGGETWQLLAFDIYTYDPSLGVDVQIDYGVTEFYSQSDQWDTSDWLKAKVDLRAAGLELTDEMYFRWVWHTDCFVENEGWYIDDVRKIGLIHQGEVIWQAYKQVNLSAGESKHLQFEYPDLFLDAEKHHSETYWYMVEFKNIDDDPSNDIKKDPIIIEDWHDVGVIDLTIEPTYQQAPGKVDLEPVTIDATIQNFGTYVEEDVPVDLTVTNLVHQTVYFEDFEAGAMGWEHGAFDGPDLWHRTSVDAYSGSYSMGCFDDAGFYDNNMYINYLLGPVIDFEKLGAKGAELSFYAKWAMESPNDSWLIFLYDPTSNYILMHGPLATYYSRDIGYEIHHPDGGAPNEWWGPTHNWGFGQGGTYGDFFKRDLFAMMDYWMNAYPGVMFLDGYKCGVGFAIYSTDESGWVEPDNPEKWSGLFIDDVKIDALLPNNVVYEETAYIDEIEDQDSTVPIQFKWGPIEYGNYIIEVATDMETDQYPYNDEMEGMTHVYYIKWLDEVEYEQDEEGNYIHDWTTEDLTSEADTHWHIEPVKCGHYNVLACGYWDDYGNYLYGDGWDEAVQPCDAPWDLSLAEGVLLEFDYCAEIEAGYDYIYVEISDDGGQTWEPIWSYTGISPDCWQHVEIPIYAEDLSDSWLFRFRFTSDESGHSSGIFIDNVILEEIHADYVEPYEMLYEDFTKPLIPPGWDQILYSGTGYWEITDETYYKPYGYSGKFLAADSDSHPSDVYDVECFTPAMDMTGATNVAIHFGRNFQDFAGDGYAEVNVYSGGYGPGYLEENLWSQDYDDPYGGVDTWFYIDPSTYSDPSEVYVGFYYSTEGGTWAWSFAIDNLEIYNADTSEVYLEEDFEGAGAFPPAGWTVIKTTDETNFGYPCYWDYISYWYHSPPSSAGLWWGYQPQDEWLISPTLDFSQPYQYMLDFWTYNYGYYAGYWEGDYVMVSPDNGATWITLDNLYESAPPYPGGYLPGEVSYDLTPYAGNSEVKIAFWRWTGEPNNNLGIWFVDDVTVIGGGYTPGSDIRWIFNDDFEHGWKWCTPHAPKDLWHVQEASGEPQVPYGPGERPPYSEAVNGSQFWSDEKLHEGKWTYMDLMDNLLISPELSLYQAYAAQLVFWAYGITPADYDSLFVSVRRIVDGVPQEWETPFIVDLAPGWNEYRLDLNPWVGPDSVIQIAFRFISDYYNTFGALGVKVDDIKLDIKPDEVAPVTTCSLSGQMGNEGWYTGAVTVDLTAEDDLSGVYQTWYRVDGGSWTLYEGRFKVSTDGQHTVEYYSIDNVGNVETIKSCSFKIDATAPTASITTPQEGYIYIMGRQLFRNPLGGTIIIGGITFEATASDATSGVDYVHFSVDGMDYDDASSPYSVYWHKFDFLPKTYTLTVTPYDVAGNSGSGVSTTFKHWL